MTRTLLETVDRSPVTFLTLLAYGTLAILTNQSDPDGPSKLLEYGSCHPLLVQDGELWRLLTAAYLHGGWLHLGFNAYCLLLVGPTLEERFGSLRFALLYLVSAVAGNVLAVVWAWTAVVGGSGALFGMFAAVLATNMRQGRYLTEFLQFRGPRSVVTLIVINLALGWAIEGISNSAHVGGLIGGFALTFSFLDRGRSGAGDGVTKLIQSGWIALLLGGILYCRYPVASQNFVSIRSFAQTGSKAALARTRDEIAAPQLRRAFDNLCR